MINNFKIILCCHPDSKKGRILIMNIKYKLKIICNNKKMSLPKYACMVCKHDFTSPSHLKRHLECKKKCKNIIQIDNDNLPEYVIF